jgi:hypothetical protein
MTAIGIDYDSTRAVFVMHAPAGLHLTENNGDIWLNYEQALTLHATLGDLLEKYKDRFGKTEGIKLV